MNKCSNVKFNYLFRDHGNYKTYDYEVFSNYENLTLETLESEIRSKLIDTEFFYPSEWNLEDLSRQEGYIDAPNWNEFEKLEFTDEEQTMPMDITEFLRMIKN